MSLANFLSEFKQLTTLYEDVAIVARPERITLKSKGQELDLYLKPEGESSMYIGGTIDSLDLSPIITLANANGFFFDNTALARLLCTKGVTLTHETLSRNLAINKTPIRSELLELFDGIGRINNTYGHPSKIMSAVSKYQDLTLVLGTKALVVIKDGKILAEVTPGTVSLYDQKFSIENYSRFSALAVESTFVHRDVATTLLRLSGDTSTSYTRELIRRDSLEKREGLINGQKLRLAIDSLGRLHFATTNNSPKFTGYIKHGAILDVKELSCITTTEISTFQDMFSKLVPYIKDVERTYPELEKVMSSSQKGWYAELPYVRATAAIERNYQAVAADMYSLCMKHYKKWVEESKSAKEVVSTSIISKDTSDYQDGFIRAMNRQMINMSNQYAEVTAQLYPRSTPPPKGPPMANVSAASQPTILSMIIIKMAALLRTAGTHMADVGSDAVYRIIAEGLPDLYIELSALIKTSKLKGKRKKAAMDKIREDGKDDELQRLMIKAGFAGFIKIAPKIITDNIPGISVDRLLRELEVNVIASAGTIGGGIVKDLIGPYYDAFLFAESEVKEAVAGIAAASTSGDNTISKIKDVKIEENVPVA